jgi:integration host factor subunit alpha
MTLTKAGLAEHLYEEIGLNKREAKKLVNLFFAVTKATLTQGEPVKLSGFGNFCLRDKHSRPGRNPKTGVAATITARRVVTFKAGAKLKGQVVPTMPMPIK